MRSRLKAKRSRAWVQHVDAVGAWASEHAWLLDTVFDLFDQDGEWPRIAAIQRALADTEPSRAVAVAQLAIDMPSELGARHGDRLTLTTRALSYCEDAASLLSLFVKLIREAVVGYRASDDRHDAVLSGFAVKERLGVDDRTYIRLSTLVFREPWFFGSGGGNANDDWHYEIRAEVLLADGIEDIHDYLDVVAQYRFGPPEIPVDAQKPSRRRFADIACGWLTKRALTALDYLLIAIAGGVVAGVVLWLPFR